MHLSYKNQHKQKNHIFFAKREDKTPNAEPTAAKAQTTPLPIQEDPATTLNATATNDTVHNLMRRNPDRLPGNEVIRPTAVTVLPDLHGDYESFIEALRDHNLLDAAENWAGNDTALVLLGDIFDREQGAFKIMAKIKDLQTQGANITILSGNHEDLMLTALLTRIPFAKERWLQYGGIDTLKSVGITDFDTKKFLEQNREQLKALGKTKLLEQIDDVLYMHAEPSDQAIDVIEKYGIDEINNQWQQAVEQAFDGDSSSYFTTSFEFHPLMYSRAVSDPGFQTMMGTFSLDKPERINTVLKNMGVNMIVHGHDPQKGSIKSYKIGEIEVVNIDNAISRGMQHAPPNSRGLTITKTGERKVKL
jgi:hypothetical protein